MRPSVCPYCPAIRFDGSTWHKAVVLSLDLAATAIRFMVPGHWPASRHVHGRPLDPTKYPPTVFVNDQPILHCSGGAETEQTPEGSASIGCQPVQNRLFREREYLGNTPFASSRGVPTIGLTSRR